MLGWPMSALGQKQTSDCRPLMSAIHPKADIAERDRHVRFVPKADIELGMGNIAAVARNGPAMRAFGAII
jgi:hypothetical protein